ncbi:MAG: phosphate transport system regulatory protein PhoU [Bdellovibrionales bacterium CG10_big_fil_rev_8_21_14_0_10_45_34]|nr:MAG: phosphate transport system regulatory protein PhoU [Bdellovibrionales bacterium CG10_big_fil_rev_8_21_14_0_10_45_34]
MERQSDQLLSKLRAKVVTMGGLVEKAVSTVVTSFIEHKAEGFKLSREIENEINQLHLEIDEECLQFLALTSPRAGDLRQILAVIKINTDLERMGDQAMNISFNASDYASQEPLDERLLGFEEMSKHVQQMIRKSLDAFTKLDADLAKEVLREDDEVDQAKNQIFKKLTAMIEVNPFITKRALDLILIARNLERLGDHATNIAEDVIFIQTGEDVRHKPRE